MSYVCIYIHTYIYHIYIYVYISLFSACYTDMFAYLLTTATVSDPSGVGLQKSFAEVVYMGEIDTERQKLNCFRSLDPKDEIIWYSIWKITIFNGKSLLMGKSTINCYKFWITNIKSYIIYHIYHTW
jgi:hypothetical protein